MTAFADLEKAMRKDGWAPIGGADTHGLGFRNVREVPQWVLDATLENLQSGRWKEGDNKPLVYTLRGRTFEYAVTLEYRGQGSHVENYFRRMREKNPAPHREHDNHRRRQRATAVVVRHGKYLVVRDKGSSHYSLPGGGIERGEPALAAAAREIYEETGLTPVKAEFLFTHRGTVNEHQVIRVDVENQGRVRLQRKEIDAYEWWDGRSNLPVNSHVRDILAKLREHHADTGR